MKSTGVLVTLVLLLFTGAIWNASQASQYAPGAAFENQKKKNELAGITVVALRFCPKWFEAIYCGRQYKQPIARRIVVEITRDGQANLNPTDQLGASSNVFDLKGIDEEFAHAYGRKNNDEVTTFDLITELVL